MPGKDVNDGVYAGELTAEEVIEQFKYRAGVHLSYLRLLAAGYNEYLSFGSIEFHRWAINGYEWGIKYIKEQNPVVYRCNLAEAFATIGKAILSLFRR